MKRADELDDGDVVQKKLLVDGGSGGGVPVFGSGASGGGGGGGGVRETLGFKSTNKRPAPQSASVRGAPSAKKKSTTIAQMFAKHSSPGEDKK